MNEEDASKEHVNDERLEKQKCLKYLYDNFFNHQKMLVMTILVIIL
jgi:hypothetical protein